MTNRCPTYRSLVQNGIGHFKLLNQEHCLIKNSKVLFNIVKFLNISNLVMSERFRNVATLNQAFLFLIQLNKTAVQSVPKNTIGVTTFSVSSH